MWLSHWDEGRLLTEPYLPTGSPMCFQLLCSPQIRKHRRASLGQSERMEKGRSPLPSPGPSGAAGQICAFKPPEMLKSMHEDVRTPALHQLKNTTEQPPPTSPNLGSAVTEFRGKQKGGGQWEQRGEMLLNQNHPAPLLWHCRAAQPSGATRDGQGNTNTESHPESAGAAPHRQIQPLGYCLTSKRKREIFIVSECIKVALGFVRDAEITKCCTRLLPTA